MSNSGNVSLCLDFATRLAAIKHMLQKEQSVELGNDLCADPLGELHPVELISHATEGTGTEEACCPVHKESGTSCAIEGPIPSVDGRLPVGNEGPSYWIQDSHTNKAVAGASGDTERASTTMEQLTLGQISVLLKERADLIKQLQSSAQHSKHLEERVVYLEECLRTLQGQTPDTSMRGSPELQAWQ